MTSDERDRWPQEDIPTMQEALADQEADRRERHRGMLQVDYLELLQQHQARMKGKSQ